MSITIAVYWFVKDPAGHWKKYRTREEARKAAAETGGNVWELRKSRK